MVFLFVLLQLLALYGHIFHLLIHHIAQSCGIVQPMSIHRVQPMSSNHSTPPDVPNTCDFCGSDYAGAEEMRMSRPAILQWKNEIDALISQSSKIDN